VFRRSIEFENYINICNYLEAMKFLVILRKSVLKTASVKRVIWFSIFAKPPAIIKRSLSFDP